ncbi:hypothetical protein PR202_ga00492 [Eleusine coracana subsp. coracana]|uniref:Rx N-terminal domain-containing protein n=1 Tax=Eleusine coracana subsp. coracana TaxID=191504 RepID=A0AAV5BET5_ELECO|nr:hypothetical protein PR202_ga00492 [Eleusine coracana subsp. coracana]
MHALLLKLAAKEGEESMDIQRKMWARDVREMAYDVQDYVDAFTDNLSLVRAGGGEQGWGFAPRISELKARMVEVGEHRARYDFGDLNCGSDASQSFDPWVSSFFSEEDHLIGIDGSTEDFVSWL